MIKQIKYIFIITIGFIFTNVYAEEVINLFPLKRYNQDVAHWINPNEANYDKRLMTATLQQQHYAMLKEHFVGKYSPWDRQYVTTFLSKSGAENLYVLETEMISNFTNHADKPEKMIGYGANFLPYLASWTEAIAYNMNVDQLKNLSYQADQRAIAIKNLQARILPTYEPFFYHYNLGGQGYPFDNLQVSSIWIGTPLYVIAKTRDLAWSLVLTPDFIGWVENQGLAMVTPQFIANWQQQADQSLASIIKTKTALIDNQQQFISLAYVGTIFPAQQQGDAIILFVPVSDKDQYAVLKSVKVTAKEAVLLPWDMTPRHIAQILETLIGRTYGWGNYYFFNDCSAELKNFFAAFGIWLPRHSSDQVSVGKMIDQSARSPAERLNFLREKGKPFLTLIYIGGHVMLYVGNTTNETGETYPLSYQNIWGLKPEPPTRRSVIGKSVFLPLFLKYPEDASLQSLAALKYFQVSFLDELPTNESTSSSDLRANLLPETSPE